MKVKSSLLVLLGLLPLLLWLVVQFAESGGFRKKAARTGTGPIAAEKSSSFDDPHGTAPNSPSVSVSPSGVAFPVRTADGPRTRNALGQVLPFRERKLSADFLEKLLSAKPGDSLTLGLFPEVQPVIKVTKRLAGPHGPSMAMVLVGHPPQDRFYLSLVSGRERGLMEIPSRNLAYEVIRKKKRRSGGPGVALFRPSLRVSGPRTIAGRTWLPSAHGLHGSGKRAGYAGYRPRRCPGIGEPAWVPPGVLFGFRRGNRLRHRLG